MNNGVRSRRLVMGGVLAIVMCSLALWGTTPTALAGKGGSSVSRIRLGNAANGSPTLLGPSFFLQGNGAPLTTAFQAHINQIAAAPVDVVILAASAASSGSPTPECDTIIALSNVNACETITITQSAGANDSGATTAVQNAEIVYFAGGDQCNYVGWKGSSVFTAVKGVVARNGGVGGGSAGLAIQGDSIYDACRGSVTSSEALADPYRRAITFTYDYFTWQNLGQVITDSHFAQRDRMGRLMTFVCRQIKDGKTSAAYGLGVDENTVVLVDKNGLGTVYGGAAYMVLGDHSPEKCASRQPLSFSNFKLWKINAGGSYNFAVRPTSGYYLRSVTNGVISSDPYTP